VAEASSASLTSGTTAAPQRSSSAAEGDNHPAELVINRRSNRCPRKMWKRCGMPIFHPYLEERQVVN